MVHGSSRRLKMRQTRDDSGSHHGVSALANLGADRVETARFVGFATLAFV